MEKIKYFIIGAVVITLVLSTTGSIGIYDKNVEISSMGPILEVTTDKTVYSLGETVMTILTNVGDEMMNAGGPTITIYNEDNEIVYHESIRCWHELEPGEYIEWPWDQTNQQGCQVPSGEYVVEGSLSQYVDEAIFYILSDELDQSQTNYDEQCPGPVGYFPFNTSWNVSIAQSFIPTKEILTRVMLYAGKNVTVSRPYVLAIRDNLTGENLALVNVGPGEFMVIPNLSWIEFDFSDIIINIGETYYIISYTSNITDNTYVWGANCSDIYPNGTAHVSMDGGNIWEDAPQADLCFMTYGRDNQPPTAPNINGQTSGKAGKEYEYTITGSDPDGDELYVTIDWGDNTSSGLLGPYDGSYNITKKHAWEEKGNYTIKARAKDPYVWGPEGTLKVTMPKNKPKSSPMPSFGLSIVFFRGNALVYRHIENNPSITLRPYDNKVKWFCLGKPWFSSSHGYVGIDKYRGIIKPEPIEGENISFLFVIAKEVIVMK